MASSAPSDGPADGVRERVIAATLRCIARWGIAKTTLDDVAREAGCGRATIYRTFSGGKAEVLRATLQSERRRLLAAFESAVEPAEGLEDVLVCGVTAVSRFLRGHDALAYLLAHEPDAVLPHVAFANLDRVFGLAARVAEPYLAPYVPASETRAAAEWVTRFLLAFTVQPAPGIDLTDPDQTRRLVRTYLIPALVPADRAEGSISPRSV